MSLSPPPRKKFNFEEKPEFNIPKYVKKSFSQVLDDELCNFILRTRESDVFPVLYLPPLGPVLTKTACILGKAYNLQVFVYGRGYKTGVCMCRKMPLKIFFGKTTDHVHFLNLQKCLRINSRLVSSFNKKKNKLRFEKGTVGNENLLADLPKIPKHIAIAHNFIIDQVCYVDCKLDRQSAREPFPKKNLPSGDLVSNTGQIIPELIIRVAEDSEDTLTDISEESTLVEEVTEIEVEDNEANEMAMQTLPEDVPDNMKMQQDEEIKKQEEVQEEEKEHDSTEELEATNEETMEVSQSVDYKNVSEINRCARSSCYVADERNTLTSFINEMCEIVDHYVADDQTVKQQVITQILKEKNVLGNILERKSQRPSQNPKRNSGSNIIESDLKENIDPNETTNIQDYPIEQDMDFAEQGDYIPEVEDPDETTIFTMDDIFKALPEEVITTPRFTKESKEMSPSTGAVKKRQLDKPEKEPKTKKTNDNLKLKLIQDFYESNAQIEQSKALTPETNSMSAMEKAYFNSKEFVPKERLETILEAIDEEEHRRLNEVLNYTYYEINDNNLQDLPEDEVDTPLIIDGDNFHIPGIEWFDQKEVSPDDFLGLNWNYKHNYNYLKHREFVLNELTELFGDNFVPYEAQEDYEPFLVYKNQVMRHILEIYDLNSSISTEHVLKALHPFHHGSLYLKWADDYNCLIVFDSDYCAREMLKYEIEGFKMRRIVRSSIAGALTASRCNLFQAPTKKLH